MKTTIIVDELLWQRFRSATIWHGETMQHALEGMIDTYVALTFNSPVEAERRKKKVPE